LFTWSIKGASPRVPVAVENWPGGGGPGRLVDAKV
jgi:hypothetical protein